MADARRSARQGIATTVWLLAVVAAVILAAGALVVALEVDRRSQLVDLLVTTAGTIDVLGVLADVELEGRDDAARRDPSVRTVLVSWSLCAVVYLVIGKILDRLVRP